MKPYSFHPIANCFPLMGNDELEALAEDIQKNGLIHPIVIYDNQILDGRNRYMAAGRINRHHRDSDYTFYTGDDPIGYVASLNNLRRHMTTEQKIKAINELLVIERELAKKRQIRKPGVLSGQNYPDKKEPNRARDVVAKAVGVSSKTVAQANRVSTQGAPEVKQAMETGTISINKAEEIVKEVPKEDQPLIVEEIKQVEQAPAKEKKAMKASQVEMQRIRKRASELGYLKATGRSPYHHPCSDKETLERFIKKTEKEQAKEAPFEALRKDQPDFPITSRFNYTYEITGEVAEKKAREFETLTNSIRRDWRRLSTLFPTPQHIKEIAPVLEYYRLKYLPEQIEAIQKTHEESGMWLALLKPELTNLLEPSAQPVEFKTVEVEVVN